PAQIVGWRWSGLRHVEHISLRAQCSYDRELVPASLNDFSRTAQDWVCRQRRCARSLLVTHMSTMSSKADVWQDTLALMVLHAINMVGLSVGIRNAHEARCSNQLGPRDERSHVFEPGAKPLFSAQI